MNDFLAYLGFAIAAILALILAFQERAGRRTPPTDVVSPESATDDRPVGDKAGTILLAMFQDFYRQELAAEEDVHRTLPFFGTALGLIVAALNYAGSQLPDWATVIKTCSVNHVSFDRGVIACAWPATLTAVLLVISALTGVGVLWLLALATKRRNYERVGPERVHLNRARALREYHLAQGLTSDDLDTAVTSDLRDQLLQDFAIVLPINRSVTLQRYKLRARAVAYLLWSLFIALVATIIILMTAKTGLLMRGLP
jgi:hypothetical protein